MMLDRGEKTLARHCPHLLEGGLEPDAMFVDGPQLDARLWESGRHLPQQGAEMGFKLNLGQRIGLHMTWPRFQPAGAESPQIAPAQLTADLASEAPSQPLGHGPAAPAVAVGMQAGHGRS
jgi:hypothetical protein